MFLAFYRGRRTLSDRVICWVTRSKFSHVELLDGRPPKSVEKGFTAVSWSASGRDGGVRGKRISFVHDRWSFVEAPWAPAEALEVLKALEGRRYDYFGLLASQVFNLRRHARKRWFCSEICAHALGLAKPQEVSPGTLHRRVLEMNRAYEAGLDSAGDPPEE